MLNSEFVHFMITAFNPFMPNGISLCYQLEHSISVLRDVRWYFSFFIPPANFVCGGVYCFHVVRACVYASVCASVRNVLFF